MAIAVLATKLFIPPLRPQSVSRPRLLERLDDGLQAGRKLTLISAPAGFGKTTLLSEWIAETQRLKPQVRVAWLSLEKSDNDPVRFLAYLVAALYKADAAIGPEDDGIQQSAEETLTGIVNEIAQSAHELILVLDDFQLIEASSIRDTVVFLLDHLPSTLHVAIASRSDPLLPVARLRARGELTELRAADLRFTPDEAAAFLNQAMGLSLSSDDVAALETRTEGWIAGLQLAALSMRDHSDIPGFIAAFTGSHRFVIDYLVEEVLHREPLHVREFLCNTAILDRFNASLCDAVTGQTGGSEMLESLERANLFLVPLDDRREWFRYHHLFADVLKARLLAHGPERVSALHNLASDWYEVHGLPEEAIGHALAAPDFDRAARVIETTIPGIKKSRQDATLLHWLAVLPQETIARRPVLSVYSAWSSLVSGDPDGVESWLGIADELLAATTEDGSPAHDSAPGEELRQLPVTIAVYRAAVAQARGDLTSTAKFARQALELTRPDDHLGRGQAAGFLGLASWASGDLEAGVRAFGEVRTSLLLAGNTTDALATTIVLADMLLPLGRLRQAHAAYQEALAEAVKLDNQGGQPTAILHVGISELLRERNDLAEATEHLYASEALGESGFSHENRYRWFVAMARIREAEGQFDLALELLTTAEQLYLRGFFPEVRPIAAMKARIWIAQGRLAEAAAWCDEQSLSSTDELTYLGEFAHITVARLRLAQYVDDLAGGSVQELLELLGRLLEAAEAGSRVGSANEILVLQALALEAKGQTQFALGSLERALTQAEPEGYVRLFLDEGAPMQQLLRAAAEAGIQPDYVRRLIQAPQSVSPSLSDRELHVLRLLATALSGPQIARELYVSLNTMRTHTKHIFEKLDVKSRPEAVRRATEQGLI